MGKSKGSVCQQRSTKRTSLVRAGKASKFMALYPVEEACKKAGLVKE
jgi:hypothetical protein